MSTTITPATPTVKNFSERGALDSEHGLSKITKKLFKGINSKEAATAALAGEMETNLGDIRRLRSFLGKKGTSEMVEGTKEYNSFKGILGRLKAQGHETDISALAAKVKKNGKTVFVFDEKQKKNLKDKLDGMANLTKQSQEENKTKLQKLSQEERDLWNLISNMIKIYYDQMKSIITDTTA